MDSATTFTKLNDLHVGSSGVFQSAGAKDFNYSDGAEAERTLQTILETAKDLSSRSKELEKHIIDWPTEYHLSSSRANLLRGLDLTGVTRVLELGCGCGSISRYLGEQDGLQIDAIEGSPIRASLAALRCRDLPNVTISTGNFNTFAFPEEYYDLVLFVGVTEYAGRFSDQATDQAALQDLLALAKNTSKDDGVVLVAIENRTGLKYLMGANEDHYGIPYVGIDDYPESTGIRTYTKNEWQSQISQAGYTINKFVYPFPDYKVPTLIVHEDCEITSDKLQRAFDKIKSRDYLTKFDLGDEEPRIWQGVIQARGLAQFTNSFLILIGDDKRSVARMLDFDLIEYPQSVHQYHINDVPNTTSNENEVQLHALIAARQRLISRVEALKNELSAIRNHADNLQKTVDLLTQSKGWKLLNRLRSIFRKSKLVD